MEEVGAISGDNQATYDKICRSLAKIVVKEGHKEYIVPGIIAVSGDDYCYIIAFCNKMLQANLSEVILPDGRKMKLKKQDVTVRLDLTAFYVQTSARIEPVDFSEGVSMNEEVLAFVFDRRAVGPLCYMSHGRVTYTRPFAFSHDSPPSYMTTYGGLVFNKKAEFLGISYKDRGVTIAHNLEFITRILGLGFHPEMSGKPLSEILQHIDGQAKSRKNIKIVDQAKRKRKGR